MSDILSNLFANAIRSPMPSTSTASSSMSASSPAASRPSLAHSKSIGAEQTTPRRPAGAAGVGGAKRLPRRSTAAAAIAASSLSTTPVMNCSSSSQQRMRKGGSVSPQSSSSFLNSTTIMSSSSCSLGSSYIPFAGAKFSDSPSARAIPLPPTVWFEDEESPCAPSDTESISSFTTSSSSSSSSSSSDSLPPFARSLSPSGTLAAANLIGVRVTPLALIAAVSAQ